MVGLDKVLYGITGGGLQEIAPLLIINILQIFVIMHIRCSICSNFIQNFKQSVVSQVFLKSFQPY